MDIQTYLQKINESPLSQAHKDQIVALVGEHGFNDAIALQIQEIIKADMEESEGVPLSPEAEEKALKLNSEISTMVNSIETEAREKTKTTQAVEDNAKINALRDDLMSGTS